MSDQSPEIGELAKALAAAQGVMEGAKKQKSNPHFKSKYADLQSVWDACREPLAKNGLSVTQTSSVSEHGQVVLITTLMHSGGQWIRGGYPVIAERSGPQPLMAAMTYARRASLAAIVGIAPEDDDGNEAQGRDKLDAVTPERERPRPESKKPEKKASEALPETYLPTNPIPAGILLAIKALHHLKDTPLTVMVLEDLELVREKLLAALERWVNDNRVSQHAIEISQQIVSASEMLIDKRKAETDGKA